MSKYHKGDKFIVEIKEVMKSDNGTLYRSEFSTLTFDDYGLDKLQKVESSANTAVMQAKAYNKGLEDAWELIKQITEPRTPEDVSKVLDYFGIRSFSLLFSKYTPQEALAKYEAYIKAQEEIKVGDVVKVDEREFIITSVSKNYLSGIDGNGLACAITGKVQKTGRTVDIASILAEIGKE